LLKKKERRASVVKRQDGTQLHSSGLAGFCTNMARVIGISGEDVAGY